MHAAFLSCGLHTPHAPWLRLVLGLTTRDEWIKNTTVQIFVTDYHGIRDFDLSVEDLKMVTSPQ